MQDAGVEPQPKKIEEAPATLGEEAQNEAALREETQKEIRCGAFVARLHLWIQHPPDTEANASITRTGTLPLLTGAMPLYMDACAPICGCDVTIYGCNVTIYGCDVTIYGCDVTIYGRNASVYGCNGLQVDGLGAAAAEGTGSILRLCYAMSGTDTVQFSSREYC
eukprot:3940868-Rhodomonas_salina.1